LPIIEANRFCFDLKKSHTFLVYSDDLQRAELLSIEQADPTCLLI